MSDDFEFASEPEPEDGEGRSGPQRSFLLRVASAVTLCSVAGGTLWMAYGIHRSSEQTIDAAENTSILIDTAIEEAPEPTEPSPNYAGYVEAGLIGFVLGVGGATVRAAIKNKPAAKPDGSHEQYDDPLDTRLFEGYCRQVTRNMVWVDGRILDGDDKHNEFEN